MKILMVCLGNICRSPMAEGILKHQLEQHNINNVEVDSAGFEPFHQGDRPDRRGMATMKSHGIDISEIRSRLFQLSDFDRFDRIFVMDNTNYQDVIRLARDADDKRKVDFLLNQIQPGSNRPVPDPYYGGDEGFETVYHLIDRACEKIVIDLKSSK